MKDEVVSALQEFLRTLTIGVVWALVSVIVVIQAGINKDLGTFAVEWNVAQAVFAVEVLTTLKVALGSAADKWLHKSDVKTPLNFGGLDQLKD